MKILLTDGDALHCLAIARLLGRKGFDLTIGSQRRFPSVAFASKYCNRKVIYPDPGKHPDRFRNFLFNYLGKNKHDVLLPLRSTVVPVISDNREALSKLAAFVLPEKKSLDIALSKTETFKTASGCGLTMPATCYPESMSDVEEFATSCDFPVVSKTSFGAGSRGVYYHHDRNGLISYCKNYLSGPDVATNPLILQEFIIGPGCGFFGLFDHGQLKTYFMHRRIREYPITGGPSVLAESFYNETLKTESLKLMGYLNWHGIAMVEFKYSPRKGKFVLMEINPKFWGSSDLSIHSGIEFAHNWIQLARGEEIPEFKGYTVGKRFRWLVPGDLMYLLANFGLSSSWYASFFDKRISTDMKAWDIKPFFVELILVAGYFYLYGPNIRYPFGRIPLTKDIDIPMDKPPWE
ncbi:MAG: carboxylate--amine ligase [candidate division Zixibacteria bacterium]|nr:carboxylate--amine ligase [candidate division Zixibacteria bacterium]